MSTNFEHFFNRLKLASDTKTDTALANSLGISKTALANWKKRESVDYGLIFTTFEHVDLNWLVRGEEEQNTVKSFKLSDKPANSGGKGTIFDKIPFIDTGLTALKLKDLKILLTKPKSFISLPGAEDCSFSTIYFGDEMHPEVSNGDSITVKRIMDFSWFNYGKSYLVCTEEQIICRYIKKSDSIGFVTLVAENDFFDTIEMPVKAIKELYLVKFVDKRKTI